MQVNLAVRTDLPVGTELPPVPGELPRQPRLPGEMTFTVKPGLLASTRFGTHLASNAA